MIQLIRNFDTSSIKFKKVRKTASGSMIIDIEDMPYLQTPFCKILYPVEYSLNIEASGDFLTKVQEIDNIIVNHCAKTFDFCPQDISQMYKSIIKYYNDTELYTFRVSLNTNTVIFDSDPYSDPELQYSKEDAKDILNTGADVRLLFKLKKITFSNHEIKLQIDVNQIELFR